MSTSKTFNLAIKGCRKMSTCPFNLTYSCMCIHIIYILVLHARINDMADIPSSIIHPVQAKQYGNLRKKALIVCLRHVLQRTQLKKYPEGIVF